MSRAWWRSPAAMLVISDGRSAVIARLHNAAMTCGPCAVRTWERSSSKVTSRTQCSGSRCPSCSTIYLDKPTRRHTLMQTIARANWVFLVWRFFVDRLPSLLRSVTSGSTGGVLPRARHRARGRRIGPSVLQPLPPDRCWVLWSDWEGLTGRPRCPPPRRACRRLLLRPSRSASAPTSARASKSHFIPWVSCRQR